MEDTVDLSVEFCPGCNPQDLCEHLPGGKVWVPRWHELCQPRLDGVEDAGVALTGYMSGSSESEGESNRLIQALIR